MIGGLLNFAILAVIVTPIIRVYRQRGGALALPSGSALSTERDARRLRMLWIGLFLYGIITLSSFRFLVEAPPRLLIAVVAGVLVNVGMLVAFVVAIRRVSKRLKK